MLALGDVVLKTRKWRAERGDGAYTVGIEPGGYGLDVGGGNGGGGDDGWNKYLLGPTSRYRGEYDACSAVLVTGVFAWLLSCQWARPFLRGKSPSVRMLGAHMVWWAVFTGTGLALHPYKLRWKSVIEAAFDFSRNQKQNNVPPLVMFSQFLLFYPLYLFTFFAACFAIVYSLHVLAYILYRCNLLKKPWVRRPAPASGPQGFLHTSKWVLWLLYVFTPPLMLLIFYAPGGNSSPRPLMPRTEYKLNELDQAVPLALGLVAVVLRVYEVVESRGWLRRFERSDEGGLVRFNLPSRRLKQS